MTAVKKLCGNCYIESDYIYVNDLGAAYQPNFVSQHFRALLEKVSFGVVAFTTSATLMSSPKQKFSNSLIFVSLKLIDLVISAYSI